MLHAEHLIVTHPITHKELDLRAPLPADFKAQLTELRKLAKAAAKARRLIAEPAKPRKKAGPPPPHQPRDSGGTTSRSGPCAQSLAVWPKPK